MNDWLIFDRRSSEEKPGAPCVLLHGLVISSLYLIPLAECLAQHTTVYVPDQPGFGLSDGPPHALNIVEMADAMISWMDAAGIKECHLVANSLGCQIATAMALEAPERIRTLTLIGPTTDPRSRHLWGQTWRIIWDAPHEPLRLWINHTLDQWRAGCRRIWAMIFHMLRDRIEDRLPRVQQPTLVLRGKNDPSAPDRWVREVANLLPHGQLRTLPGWHCVHYTHPALTAEVIRDFVRSNDQTEVKA